MLLPEIVMAENECLTRSREVSCMRTVHAHDVPVIEPDSAASRPSSGDGADDIPPRNQEGDPLRQRLLNLILRNEAQRKAQPR